MATARKSAPAKKAGAPKQPRTRTRLAPEVAGTTVAAAPAPAAQLKPELPKGWVMAHSPVPWTLTTDDHAKHPYPKGTCPMPKEHAEHNYAKANGVTIV